MAMNSEKGFTLIEIILVILIAVVLAAVASLSLTNLSTARLDNAVSKVVADLRYAQQLALTTQLRHGLTINSVLQYTGHLDGTPDTPFSDPVSLGEDLVVNFDTYVPVPLNGVEFSGTTPFCGGGRDRV